MRRLRLAVLVFAAVAVLSAGSAQAAPFAYTDEAGDSMDARASMDIVAVRYDVRQVNKGGPPSLVVEMELAAPPEGQLASYSTSATADGCGHFDTSYEPGTAFSAALDAPSANFWIGCGSPADETGSTSTLIYGQFRIDGNVLRWSIAMDSIPKELRGGSTLSQFQATSQLAEPGIGFPVPPLLDTTASDELWSY